MTIRLTTHGIAALALVLVLSSCEGLKKQIGLAKSAPDEFTVVTKAPLILPPDFTLRPTPAWGKWASGGPNPGPCSSRAPSHGHF